MRFVLLLLLAQPVCALADIESDFLAARAALRAGNGARLEKVADRLKDSPLEPYITYYELRMRFSTKASVAAKDFLARTSESPVVDQFRAEWLKYLGENES
jgi:soluble lytic murein transglycosylase